MGRWNIWVRCGLAFGVVLGAFACSAGVDNTGAAGASNENGGMGGKGGTGQTASSSSSQSSSSTAVAVGAGGFGGVPMNFVCDPPAEPGSLYENSAKSYDINDIDAVSMCQYRGKVALIVNTAAV